MPRACRMNFIRSRLDGGAESKCSSGCFQFPQAARGSCELRLSAGCRRVRPPKWPESGLLPGHCGVKQGSAIEEGGDSKAGRCASQLALRRGEEKPCALGDGSAQDDDLRLELPDEGLENPAQGISQSFPDRPRHGIVASPGVATRYANRTADCCGSARTVPKKPGWRKR